MTSGRVLTRYSLQPSRAAPPKSAAVRLRCLEHGAHGAVEHEDTGGKSVGKRLLALFETIHGDVLSLARSADLAWFMTTAPVLESKLQRG